MQDIGQLKRAVSEMQVARNALLKEHQFELENLEKDWVHKYDQLTGEAQEKEHRLSSELRRAA